jgi:N-acetylmuramoyl-L-alanine amidase
MATFKIALSAGHGKNTAGKRCMKKLDPNQTREWVLNARIAEKIEKLLSGYTGWELLRLDDRTGEKDIALKTRTSSANAWGADFYLSIHHNAGVLGGKGGGIVAYVYTNPSNASIVWQKELYSELIAETGLRGNRSNPLPKANLHECRVPKMPAVLLELGFMDSKTDVPIILSEKYADQCAEAIVRVIAEQGKLVKKSGSAGSTAPQDKVEEKPNAENKVEGAKEKDASLKGTYVVKSSDGCLNLRAGADYSKALIETMKNGTKVSCYGWHTGDWLLVIAESGNAGFCHRGYLVKQS